MSKRGNASPDHPARETATASINALVPPTMRRDFERWAAARGFSRSGAVKALISDALARDARTAPNAMYRRLEADPRQSAETAPEAAPGADDERSTDPAPQR
jgi:hypothetical protein